MDNILDSLEPTYLKSELTKHGITLEEVKTILRNDVGVNRKPFEFDESEPSPSGNDRTMFVGFSKPNKLIEVGMEWERLSDKERTIYGAVAFHARKASELYEEAYYEDEESA
ncbi:MAG: hypothetical protein ACRD3W_25000 [Terriglobales bacterium]